MTKLIVQPLTAGQASGRIAKLTSPLSLWGGLDLATGRISDVTHPQCGHDLKGRILAMSAARGSSSSSSALVEAVRSGTAPGAIILGQIDPILVIGSLVAADLYDKAVPIVLVSAAQWDALSDGDEVRIDAGECEATVEIVHAGR